MFKKRTHKTQSYETQHLCGRGTSLYTVIIGDLKLNFDYAIKLDFCQGKSLFDLLFFPVNVYFSAFRIWISKHKSGQSWRKFRIPGFRNKIERILVLWSLVILNWLYFCLHNSRLSDKLTDLLALKLFTNFIRRALWRSLVLLFYVSWRAI